MLCSVRWVLSDGDVVLRLLVVISASSSHLSVGVLEMGVVTYSGCCCVMSLWLCVPSRGGQSAPSSHLPVGEWLLCACLCYSEGTVFIIYVRTNFPSSLGGVFI